MLILLGIAGSFFVYVQSRDRAAAGMYADLAALKAKIDPADIAQLAGSDSDLNSPAYQRIKATLTDVPRDRTDIRFAYVMGKNASGDVFFYADSEDPSSPDYSPPGQVYYEASPKLKSLWTDPRMATEGPESDRWGLWISAFDPIQLPNHQLAVLGVDEAAGQYVRALSLRAAIPAVIGLLLAGIWLLMTRRT